jgi:hypothetical protein
MSSPNAGRSLTDVARSRLAVRYFPRLKPGEGL